MQRAWQLGTVQCVLRCVSTRGARSGCRVGKACALELAAVGRRHARQVFRALPPERIVQRVPARAKVDRAAKTGTHARLSNISSR